MRELWATMLIGLCIAAGVLAQPPVQPFAPPDQEPPPPVLPPPEPLVPPVPHDDRPFPLFLLGEPDPLAPRYWFRGEYVLFFTSPAEFAFPLATTGTVASQGVLGHPDTRILLQGSADYGTFNGFQYTLGNWSNPSRTFGTEGTAFFLEQRARSFRYISDGTVPIFRPFIDANTGAQSSSAVALPGLLRGSFVAETRLKMSKSDSNLLFNLHRDQQRSIHLLLGYRFVYLREELKLIENKVLLADGALSFLGVPLLTGDTVLIQDRFENVTRLYMAQIGARGDYRMDRLTLQWIAKFAMGWSHARLYADGRSQTTTPPGPAVPGGLLAQPTYTYRSSNDTLAVVPELQLRVGYRLLPRLYAFGGYNVMYISSVARPGTQLDMTVNTTQAPTIGSGVLVGPARPLVPDNSTDFTVHGLSFGFQFNY